MERMLGGAKVYDDAAARLQDEKKAQVPEDDVVWMRRLQSLCHAKFEADADKCI